METLQRRFFNMYIVNSDQGKYNVVAQLDVQSKKEELAVIIELEKMLDMMRQGR